MYNIFWEGFFASTPKDMLTQIVDPKIEKLMENKSGGPGCIIGCVFHNCSTCTKYCYQNDNQ